MPKTKIAVSQLPDTKTIQSVSIFGTGNFDVITVGTTAPAAPTIGQLWIDTN